MVRTAAKTEANMPRLHVKWYIPKLLSESLSLIGLICGLTLSENCSYFLKIRPFLFVVLHLCTLRVRKKSLIVLSIGISRIIIGWILLCGFCLVTPWIILFHSVEVLAKFVALLKYAAYLIWSTLCIATSLAQQAFVMNDGVIKREGNGQLK